MKPLSLTRRIDLEKYDLLMEIGRQENRQELHSILLLGLDTGGKITPNDICEKLLLDRPLQVGRAILDRCRYLDLVDYDDRLTDIGYEAIKNEKVFIPERGRYLLWYTDDPLHKSKVLHIEGLAETPLYNEIHVNRNGNQQTNNEKTEEIPNKIKALEGKTLTIFGKGKSRIQIRKINTQGIKKKLDANESQRVTLKLNPKQISKTAFDGRFKFEEPKPEINYEQSWRSILGPHSAQWETINNHSALKTNYLGLDEKELFSFTTNLHLNKPTLYTYGQFEDTTIQNIPIKPATQSDAMKWGKHLLKKSINTYMNQKIFAERQEHTRTKFPDYPNLTLPSTQNLINEFKESRHASTRLPPEYWYLQAPIDLTEGGIHHE